VKTEQEIIKKISIEIKEKIIALAEGFELRDKGEVWFNNENLYFIDFIEDWSFFPLLIHRAIEGIWKTKKDITLFIHSDGVYFSKDGMDLKFQFGIYQPENLTACGCALLDCFIEVLK